MKPRRGVGVSEEKKQEQGDLHNCFSQGECCPCFGPEPLLLSQKDVDELYNLLETLLECFSVLELETVAIAGSLLGAIRSESVLFHSDGNVEIAVVSGDASIYQRIHRELPSMLEAAAKKRSKLEGRPIVYSHHHMPTDACEKFTSSVSLQVRIHVYVLREFQRSSDLRQQWRQNSIGELKIEDSNVSVMDELVGKEDSFPLFSFDSPRAFDTCSSTPYITKEEMYPLQPATFGHLQLRAPSDSIGILMRTFGEDCFTHFACCAGHSGSREQGSNPVELSNGPSRIPLSDEQYLPIQHSKRRGWSNHCKAALNLSLDEYEARRRPSDRVPKVSSEPLTPATSSSSSTSSESSSSSGFSMSRTRTLFAFDSVKSGGYSMREDALINPAPQHRFGQDVAGLLGNNNQEEPTFGSELRAIMEPHLRKARKEREVCRAQRVEASSLDVHQSIASAVGVPYTVLRQEQRFLFDEHSYPLHLVLAEILGVDDLAKLHEHPTQDKLALLQPLLANRQRFQTVYDSFVTSFCIPLLHSMAMNKGILHSSSKAARSNSRITYRYQAFPSIQVARPGEAGEAPRCDTSHSIGSLHFFIPLTPIFGTNALYTESHPGREDWHALTTKSFGLGYIYDGARCLHFTLDSTTTETTRVSLEFRIALYREQEEGDDEDDQPTGELSTPKMLQDDYSSPPGYYDEAVVETGVSSFPLAMVAQKRSSYNLFAPDGRNGFPFSLMS